MSSTETRLAPLLPHGGLQEVFENIWILRGQMQLPMIVPMKMSRNMVVLRDAKTNELSIINSIRLSEKGLTELEKLGEITNVIRIGGYHGRDDAFYRERCGAKIYAMEGQTYSRKFSTPSDVTKGYMQPDVWVKQAQDLPFECDLKLIEGSTPPEALICLKRKGGVLIACDALQNITSIDEFVNFPMRMIIKRIGLLKPYNVGPGWLKFADPNLQDIQSILDLEFEHVLLAHGDPVIGNAKDKFSSTIQNLVS